MTVKQKGSSSFVNYFESTGRKSYTYGSYSDRIEYQDGPKYVDGHVNWKQCTHTWRKPPSYITWTANFYKWWGNPQRVSYGWTGQLGASPRYQPPTFSEVPSTQELWDKFYDQLDLNCSDGVLLYSGILQAVPLVGGALKGVSLLNRAARNLAKSLRKQPFTTVVKQLIQADFIDRFVVSPTLDDMRKFADATDYVLRVLNTAHSRNNEVFTAFEQKTSVTTKESTGSWDGNQGAARWHLSMKHTATASAELRVIARVTYDTAAISPIKLWAARVGLSRPLDSVWDLIPFSFVIDYFTRAGDFISHVGDALSDQEALRPTAAIVSDAWLLQKVEGLSRVIGNASKQSHVESLVVTSNEAEISFGEFRRFRVPIMNDRGFWDRGGFIQPNLSSTRQRTLAELGFQLLT
jgi:hypothetical protein